MSFWNSTFSPSPNASRLSGHGDYRETRRRFFRKTHSNLRFLMKERYEWMQPYLIKKERVVELGAGPGLSREYLKSTNIELTDIIESEWIRQINTSFQFNLTSIMGGNGVFIVMTH